jgi:5-methylcytosine-specific restriction endonuclease McrA
MVELIARSEAKAVGLARYFTGEPCPKGHLCERMVSNRDCIDCMRERSAAAYGDEARAKSRERMNQLYLADPEKYRARSRDNYAADPEMWKARVRDYEQRHPLKVRAWQRLKKHKDAPGRFTAEDLTTLFVKQDSRCICGKHLPGDWTIDHIVPISRGGTHWPNNIQLLCMPCNVAKGQKTMAEWRSA